MKWPLVALALLVHDGNTEHDAWFHSLKSNGGFPCCDRSDCRNVPARRAADGQWEAWVDSQTFPDNDGTLGSVMRGHAPNDWVLIPERAVLNNQDNPTPGPVLCWWSGKPLCFVPGEGG